MQSDSMNRQPPAPCSPEVAGSERFLRHVGDVLRQRRERYGDMAESFEEIALRWSMVLGITVTPEQVALCMVEVKMARLIRSPRDLDGRTDLAGYAACLDAVVRS